MYILYGPPTAPSHCWRAPQRVCSCLVSNGLCTQADGPLLDFGLMRLGLTGLGLGLAEPRMEERVLQGFPVEGLADDRIDAIPVGSRDVVILGIGWGWREA